MFAANARGVRYGRTTITPVAAALALLASAGGGAACRRPIDAQPATAQAAAENVVGYPPTVLTGDGVLGCTISSKANGRQRLEIVGGNGLEFDAAVSPIVDGTVTTDGPRQGGMYRFTSHLVGKAKGRLPNVGEVELDELETQVAVKMKSYEQPGGRGTALSFTSGQMADSGIYVEFVGRAHGADGKPITFRVNLGRSTNGSGRVVPSDDNRVSHVAEKMVHIEAPITTVLVTTTLTRP